MSQLWSAVGDAECYWIIDFSNGFHDVRLYLTFFFTPSISKFQCLLKVHAGQEQGWGAHGVENWILFSSETHGR